MGEIISSALRDDLVDEANELRPQVIADIERLYESHANRLARKKYKEFRRHVRKEIARAFGALPCR